MAFLAVAQVLLAATPALTRDMARVHAGSYLPFFRDAGEDAGAAPPVRVTLDAFWMDVRPVTNAEFLQFVRAQPRWRRSQVPRLFADEGYLAHWTGDDVISAVAGKAPVTQVSWFAARAYCSWNGKRLPTVDEWEYAATQGDAPSAEAAQQVLEWYQRPTPPQLPPAGLGAPNRFGVRELFGLVWEWTQDFNSAMTTDESRDGPGANNDAFCGAGGARATNPGDYASFMRFAFRSSLKARFTVRNLGFRCVVGSAP